MKDLLKATLIVFSIICAIAFVISIGSAIKTVKTPEEALSEIAEINKEQSLHIIEVFEKIEIQEDAKIERNESLEKHTATGVKAYNINSSKIDDLKMYIKANGELHSILYEDKKLYSNGKVVAKISNFILSDEDKVKLYDISQKYVDKLLKSPSTAKYAPFTKWNFWIEDGRMVVQGYVDAQNSFGATLRSDFQLILNDLTVESFIFDGKEYIK